MSDLLLIANLAGERVAIPAADVESVVELETIIPVPGVGAHIAGLSALRSRVLTVIDSHSVLGFARTDVAASKQAMIVTADGHSYAVLVDGVEDVIEASGDVQSLPAVLRGGWPRVSTGMIEVAGELLLLVDSRAFTTLSAPQQS